LDDVSRHIDAALAHASGRTDAVEGGTSMTEIYVP
jgi:hypothetical protein